MFLGGKKKAHTNELWILLEALYIYISKVINTYPADDESGITYVQEVMLSLLFVFWHDYSWEKNP